MFGRKKSYKTHYRRSGGGILGLFRLLISIIIMAVLGVGLYQAYRSFSGIDPLTLDPKTILKESLTSESFIDFVTNLLTINPLSQVDSTSTPKDQRPALYKFAVIADSHKDYPGLQKALTQSKNAGAKFIIGIGDLSDVGTVEELKKTKEKYDASGLPYYITPGDHDLWDSRDKKQLASQNFMAVFGSPYQSFSYSNTRFILIYNSDNYLGIDELQQKWLDEEIERLNKKPATLTFAISATPFYHPSSDHFMGKVTPSLVGQAEHLTTLLKKAGVAEVLAGDTHIFSRYSEPKNDLKMTTVGAVTSDRNPQTPRYALVDVYEDGSYNIEETELK